jgi:membrane protease YdiL (CAAX protease family)
VLLHGVTGRTDFTTNVPLSLVALLEVPLWAGLLGAPLWATYRKGRRSLTEDFGLRVEPSDVWTGLGAGVVGQLLLSALLTNLYVLLGVDRDKVGETAKRLTSDTHNAVDVILLVLVVVVAAPIFEELFYRGLWLRSIERRLGSTWAIVLSALVFALVHFEPYDFPALFGFGLILGWLAVRSGRLGPGIWAHVAFNAFTVVVLLH